MMTDLVRHESTISTCHESLQEDIECHQCNESPLRVFRFDPQHQASRFDHKDGTWGDITLGPVGRLDGGTLDLLLVSSDLRTSRPVSKDQITPDW